MRQEGFRLVIETPEGRYVQGAGEVCGLFHCPLLMARLLMPEIPWASLSRHLDGPAYDYVADVKVHRLMPGQWPCIPNWHRDFVPRHPETLEEEPDRLTEEAMWLWLSGPPVTEFRDGRPVPVREWVRFTSLDEHRGTPATEHCRRVFVRVAPVDLVRAGLPRETIPASPEEWIRRHTQVYLDAENFKW